MTDHRIQYIALFLIVFAAGSLCVAELHNWQALKDYALTFGGGGVGILTGQIKALAGVSNEAGGHISIGTNKTGD